MTAAPQPDPPPAGQAETLRRVLELLEARAPANVDGGNLCRHPLVGDNLLGLVCVSVEALER